MSILLVEVVPEGILFGADRNVSWSTQQVQKGNLVINNLGHTQRPKVLRWPGQKALLGYVGAAQIGELPTDEWLFDFIGRHITFNSFEGVAEELRKEIEAQRKIDEANSDPVALIIHLGGFEMRDGVMSPVIWFIRNTYSLNSNGYADFRKEFQKSEEFWKYFKNFQPNNIRVRLKEIADDFNPFWFHQGFDLGTFNMIEGFLKFAFKSLCNSGKSHHLPSNLSDWANQVRMSILTYGAYFQAYMGPSEQFVGGGADVVSLLWP